MRGVGRVDRDAARLDGQVATVGHRIAGVDAKVYERVLELVPVGAAEARPVAGQRVQHDRLAQRALQEAFEVGDEFVDVDRAGFENLLAREVEQTAGEFGAAARRAHDLVEARHRLGVVAQRAHEELQVAHDDGEQIVEVVGDAAGEAAERLHLLRLAKARLEVLPVRDVLEADDGADALSVLDDRAARELDGRPLPSRRQKRSSMFSRASPERMVHDDRAVFGRIARAVGAGVVEEVVGVLADRFVGGEAEHVERRAVDEA